MTDFKTTLLELAEPSEKTYASEDLKALESKSNFVLKSDAVEDLGGPEGSAIEQIAYTYRSIKLNGKNEAYCLN